MAVVGKFITQKQIIGSRIESTAYTVESAVEYDILARNLKVTPSIDVFSRKYQVGDFDQFAEVPGARSVEFSFGIDLMGSGTAITPPKWGKLFRSCGWKQIIGAFGVAYVADSDLNAVPSTFVLPMKGPAGSATGPVGVKVTGRGCMGEVEVVMSKVGEPLQANFKFKGALSGVADLAANAIPGLTGHDTVSPPATLSANCTLFGIQMQANSISIKGGEKVELLKDMNQAEGYEGAYVVDRDITISLDPYLARSADNFLYDKAAGTTTGNLTGKFELWAGATSVLGNFIRVDGWAVQVTKSHDIGSREGADANSLELIATRGTTGQPIMQVTQGSFTGMSGY